jgi:hypothetical protein
VLTGGIFSLGEEQNVNKSGKHRPSSSTDLFMNTQFINVNPTPRDVQQDITTLQTIPMARNRYAFNLEIWEGKKSLQRLNKWLMNIRFVSASSE